MSSEGIVTMRNMVRVLVLALAVLLVPVGVASAHVPSAAQLRAAPSVVKLSGVKLSRTQARRIFRGSIVVLPRASFYPSDGSPAVPPPVPCAWYLDGMGMFWGGAHWTCTCLAPGVCTWVEDYIDQDGYPPGYVDVPPSGVCYVGSSAGAVIG